MSRFGCNSPAAVQNGRICTSRPYFRVLWVQIALFCTCIIAGGQAPAPATSILASLRLSNAGAGLVPPAKSQADPLGVRGINILSADREQAERTILLAAADGLNHLQLSHRIVMNLCDLRDSSKQLLVRDLTAEAHRNGIPEVCVWDHALYDTDYYPSSFCYPGTGLLDLDQPGLWDWIAGDYRDLLDRCPEVDGLVLTFIESGARVEHQFSCMSVPERLAKVVNTVAGVVCKERGKKLWLRTFAYNETEYANLRACLDLIDWLPGMGVMVKDTPHDFFLTHPDNPLIGTLGHPTLVEFDACGEYHGQSVILNTIPEYYAERWRRLCGRPDVVGYVARTDRCGNNSVSCTPAHINLYALWRVSEDPSVSVDVIWDDFLTARYGSPAVKHLKPALQASRAILDGTCYILGLNTTHHSDFRLDAPSTYSRHVAGRWMPSDSVHLGHGVKHSFHWWTDLVSTLAPPSCKELDPARAADIAGVLEKGWILPGERMSEEYLDCVIAWERDCLRQARLGFRHLRKARPFLTARDYQELYDLYERSLMCLRLRGSAAVCWWGGRIASRGPEFQTRSLHRKCARARRTLDRELRRYAAYDKPYPVGTWDWKKDAETAAGYRDWTGK